MDIFRDSIWQFWGAVIGLLGIIIAILIFLSQRNKKRLVYSVLTETPLLSIDDEIKGKIKIKYGRKNIQNIYLVMLKIENGGNVDIASSDYEQPINFSFTDSEILSAEIIDVSPKNLKPTIFIESSKLTINPILLNKKDYFVIKLLFSKYQEKLSVDARIIGVKEVEKVTGSENSGLIYDFSWLAITTIALVFFLYKVFSQSVPSSKAQLYGVMIGFLTVLILIIIGSLIKRREKE